MKRFLKGTAIALVLFLLLAMGGFWVWAVQGTADPTAEARAALESTAAVVVTTPHEWLVFTPTAQSPTVGFIFYPGGLVPPAAYAPYGRAIAEAGYLVVIPPMPLNLAFFAADVADEVTAEFPAITQWAIGGHSLGGSMAAQYAAQNPTAVAGLVLWASYPAGNADLSQQGLAVTSISGTQDGLATAADIEASRPLLPASTVYVPIEGGNHAQFGFYGPQSGDNPATIAPAEQFSQVTAATVALLAQLGNQ